jgi:hypothetical protein
MENNIMNLEFSQCELSTIEDIKQFVWNNFYKELERIHGEDVYFYYIINVGQCIVLEAPDKQDFIVTINYNIYQIEEAFELLRQTEERLQNGV